MILLQVSLLVWETTHNLVVGLTMHPVQIMQPQQWQEQKKSNGNCILGPFKFALLYVCKGTKGGHFNGLASQPCQCMEGEGREERETLPRLISPSSYNYSSSPHAWIFFTRFFLSLALATADQCRLWWAPCSLSTIMWNGAETLNNSSQTEGKQHWECGNVES